MQEQFYTWGKKMFPYYKAVFIVHCIYMPPCRSVKSVCYCIPKLTVLSLYPYSPVCLFTAFDPTTLLMDKQPNMPKFLLCLANDV